jgi:hypothetical protein
VEWVSGLDRLQRGTLWGRLSERLAPRWQLSLRSWHWRVDRPRASERERRRWTAVGTLAAYAAVCIAVIATVLASRDVTA